VAGDEEEEEKMFHENPWILTGQTKMQIKITGTDHTFLDMIVWVTDLGAGNK
jgi:DNA-directed RNA polymerase subunit L